MKRARALSALLLAVGTMLGSVTALVKAFRADDEREATYQNTALSMGDTAGDVQALREELLKKIEKLEGACGVKP